MFLARAEDEDISQKNLAQQMIQNCHNAKEIFADTIHQNVVENIQFPINSQYSEYVPVISAFIIILETNIFVCEKITYLLIYINSRFSA